MTEWKGELTQALKQTLELNGSLGDVKARIRGEVFSAINDESSVVPRPKLCNANLVLNELIIEYLAFNKYNHSVGVLIPESGQPTSRLDKSFLAEQLNIPQNEHSAKIPLLYTVLAMLQNSSQEQVDLQQQREQQRLDDIQRHYIIQLQLQERQMHEMQLKLFQTQELLHELQKESTRTFPAAAQLSQVHIPTTISQENTIKDDPLHPQKFRISAPMSTNSLNNQPKTVTSTDNVSTGEFHHRTQDEPTPYMYHGSKRS
jgi:lisH domain-containing protein FOPNL